MHRLISVIIPAFNAAETIAATLNSVMVQTHGDIEIIVINDGSTDSTESVVREFAALDRRIQLVSIPNGGVAVARNLGIDLAAGAFVAPLDADDIWHPRKLELQFGVFARGEGDLALVYNWFHNIDEAGRVIRTSVMNRVEGWVLPQLIDWNFISNGSTPLVPMKLAREIRYDEDLRRQGIQGCEDYLFQLRIARRHRYALVPAFLTGYKRTDASMSTDSGRMILSHIAVMRHMLACEPAAVSLIQRRLAEFEVEYARNRLHRGHIGAAAGCLGRAARLSAKAATVHVMRQARLFMPKFALQARRNDATPRGVPFLEIDPFAPLGMPTAHWHAKRWQALARMPWASGPSQPVS